MTIWRGSHYNVVFNLKHVDGSHPLIPFEGVIDLQPPVDMTGWMLKSQIRDKSSDKAVMIELTTENGGIVITDPLAGQFELVITAEQSVNFSLGNVVGDIFRMNGASGPERLFGFRDRVRRPVTRNE
jgi:hypothetical protein